MKKLMPFVILVLCSISVHARQDVPDRQIYVVSNANWEVLSTEDHLDEVIETLDGQIEANRTTDVDQASSIAVNVSNIAVNASNIAANAGSISNNAANLSSVSNTASNAQTTNVLQQSEIDSITNNAARTETAWGMERTNFIQTGSASTWYNLTSFDDYTLDTSPSAMDTSTGKFTPPWNGKYLLSGAATIYSDQVSTESWVVRFETDSLSASASRLEIMHIYMGTGSGNQGAEGSHILDLTTNNWVWINYWCDSPIATTNYIEHVKFRALYIGE